MAGRRVCVLQVISRLTIERVGSGATQQCVVVRSTKERVVAVLPVDRIVAGSATDEIVAVATEQRVGAVSAVDAVVANPASDRVLTVSAEDRVVAVTAQQRVVAPIADDRVRSVTAIEAVVQTVAAEQFVVAAVSLDADRGVVEDRRCHAGQVDQVRLVAAGDQHLGHRAGRHRREVGRRDPVHHNLHGPQSDRVLADRDVVRRTQRDVDLAIEKERLPGEQRALFQTLARAAGRLTPGDASPRILFQ